MSKPLCIIPARAGSKRFPRKNVALLRGKPLLSYVVEAAKESGVFDQVVVSSDDQDILRIAKESGADRALVRPEELCNDSARVPHVCAQVLEDFSAQGDAYDTFGVILPTSPLVAAEDLRAAYELFQEKEDAHYVASFVPYGEPPQYATCLKGEYMEQYFEEENVHTQSQNLEPLYYIDGSIIFCHTDVFLREGDFCMSKTVPYFIPVEHSADIDTEHELALAEFLLSQREATKVS